MIYVTRREVFSAAHRLYNPSLSEEENEKLFGKCGSPNWHGHNYTLDVIVKGDIDPLTGYVIDLKELKNILNENVIKKLDHKNLNVDVDFLKGKIPSGENLVVAIWNELVNKISKGKLYSVKLFETENNYFEYRGEEN